MKKLISLILITVLLCACAPANTMSPLDPLNREDAVILYRHDGAAIASTILSRLDGGSAILDALHRIPVQPAEKPEITFPLYGIAGQKPDGTNFYLAFTDGHCLTADGIWYTFDYDFTAGLEGAKWEATRGATFPCAVHLMIDGTEPFAATWNPARMIKAPAQEITPPPGITAEAVHFLGQSLSVRYTNHSGTDWQYGNAFLLEVKLDGIWYIVPYAMTDYDTFFTLEAIGLADSKTAEKVFHLDNYGVPLCMASLPQGSYRIVTEDLAIEFTV